MLVGGARGSQPDTRGSRRSRLGVPHDRRSRRAVALLVVYALFFGLVVHRLVSVQVLDAAEYARQGVVQRQRTIELPPRRGRVYDRNGDVLATSVDVATVYADPRAYRPQTREDGVAVPPAADAAEVAAELAPLLETDAAALEEKLRKDAHFVYVARQVPHELGERIAALELPGIGILREPKRVYPGGSLAAQVVGFTDIDGNGLAGLEVAYDRLLKGTAGSLTLEQAPGGLTIPAGGRQILPPVDGSDLVLTLDREIQHVAERAAAAAMERFDAKGAGVVVLEVGTGDVLAMASAPGFDANEPGASDAEDRRNRAVTDSFEPGSVQKAVTAAAAVEEGIATPETTYEVPDRHQVGGKVFSDAHEHETEIMTLREILATSSNVGTIKLAQDLGPERLDAHLRAFGYGEPLGIGFPGEGRGALLPVDHWSVTSLPTIAIGQGVSMTLLQAANTYAILANGGVGVPPRLVRGTVGEDGRLVPSAAPSSRQVVSAETAASVADMLRSVVGEGGTGGRAAVAGYTVAGKTGTARKPLVDARGYSSEYIASFVGFAPVEDPKLVVAVMVDEPYPIYGSQTAAPIFSEVMSFALAHRRVPPTDPAAVVASTPTRGDPDPSQ
ncbi:MAG: peptidoglycan D,D-transpeptidase FtsI family protein [Nitriliruptorales bacterium]